MFMFSVIQNLYNHFQNRKPIPKKLPGVAGWKLHPVKDNGEKLVDLGIFSRYSPKKIAYEGMYYGATIHSPYKKGQLEGALITPFLRQGVAEKLVKASELLPDDIYILVLDAYRPKATQQGLYDSLYNQLINEKNMSPDEATTYAQRFVSLPSEDPKKPSPHITGGSVDITLIQVDPETLKKIKACDKIIEEHGNNTTMWQAVYEAEIQKMSLLRNDAKELPMGTAFDEVCDATATSYFENKKDLTPEETQIRNNRRLLYNVMIAAGFTNYDEEWWHFDCGNQFDAIKTGHEAIYGVANFDEECIAQEKMRHMHFEGHNKLANCADNATTMLGHVGQVVKMTAQKNKDLNSSATQSPGKPLRA